MTNTITNNTNASSELLKNYISQTSKNTKTYFVNNNDTVEIQQKQTNNDKEENSFQKLVNWLIEPVDNPKFYANPPKTSRIKQIASASFSILYFSFMAFLAVKFYKKLSYQPTQKNKVFSEIWQDIKNAQTLDELALPKGLKENAKRLIYKISNCKDYFEKGGTNKKTILLYGPPGTGKTTYAKAIAKEFENSAFASIDLSTVQGKLVGETEQNLNAMIDETCRFAKNNPNKKVFVFFDEIDSLAIADNGSSNQQYHSSALNVLKKGISEKLTKEDNIIVIAATNMDIHDEQKEMFFVQKLAQPIVDRFDEKIKVDSPSKNQFKLAISNHYKSLSQVDDSLKDMNSKEMDEIAARLEGNKCSFRTLENMYNVAAATDKKIITYQDILEALDKILIEN